MNAKPIADLFKQHDAGLVRGGFGHVSEKIVQSWIDNHQIASYGKAAPVAAAHTILVKRPTKVKDFAGRHVATMMPKDVLFKRIAWQSATGFHDLVHEVDLTHDPVIWVEEFIEYDKDMIDCGFDRICTKIRSDSTMVGVYALSWEEQGRIHERTTKADEVTLERLAIKVPADLIDGLLEAMKKQGMEWADHYSHYNVNHTWSAVTLRGYGGREDFIIKPSEMSKKWKTANEEKLQWEIFDTPARPLLPEVEPLVNLVPGKKHRVRLMRLKAGSELLRHADITDPDAGTMDGQLLRIHIPVVTNDGCLVHQWMLDGDEKVRHMGKGEAWYLDTRKPHAVKNGGDSDRVHLVMDIESNKELRLLLGMEQETQTLEEWI